MTSTTFFYMPRSQEQYKLESIKGHITDRWLATVPNGLIKDKHYKRSMKKLCKLISVLVCYKTLK